MQLTKYFNFGNIEIKIDADYTDESLEIVSVTPIIDKGEDHKEMFENIGDAMMEEIPGFVKLLENLSWDEEIEEANRERNGNLHSRLFSSWQPGLTTIYHPAKICSSADFLSAVKTITDTHKAVRQY